MLKRVLVCLFYCAIGILDAQSQLVEKFIDWDGERSCIIRGVEDVQGSDDFLIYADLLYNSNLHWLIADDVPFTSWVTRRTNIDGEEIWSNEIAQRNINFGIQDVAITGSKVFTMNTFTNEVFCPAPDSEGDFEIWREQQLNLNILNLETGSLIVDSQTTYEECNGLPFGYDFIATGQDGSVYGHRNTHMHKFSEDGSFEEKVFNYIHSPANPDKVNRRYFSSENGLSAYFNYDYTEQFPWERTDFELHFDIGRAHFSDAGMMMHSNPLEPEHDVWAFSIRKFIDGQYEVVLQETLDKGIFEGVEDWFYNNVRMFSNDGKYFFIVERKIENNQRFFRLYQVNLDTEELTTADFGFSNPPDDNFVSSGVELLGMKELDDGTFVIYGTESYHNGTFLDSFPDRGYLAFGKVGAIQWPLAIEENEDAQVFVGPNPSTGQIILKLSESLFCESKSFNFQLFDMNGKLVQDEFLISSTEQLKVNVNIAGAYLWRGLCDGKNFASGRLVVNP